MKKIFAIVLTFTLLLSLVNLPLATADGTGNSSTSTDWTSTLPFELIEGVEVYVKEQGQADKLVFNNVPNTTPLLSTDEIKKDAQLAVKFYLNLSGNIDEKTDESIIKENDTFNIQLPPEFASAVGISSSLKVENQIEYGGDQTASTVEAINAKVIEGNILQLTFKKPVEIEKGLQGSIGISLGLDKSKIGNQNPTEIKFNIPGETTNTINIPLYFEVEKPTLQKASMGYDATTKEITWKITVNKEKAIVNNAVVSDNIPNGLTYVPGSLTVSPAIDENLDIYSDNAKKGLIESAIGSFDYYFPKEIKDTYTIEYKTKLDNALLTDTAYNNQILTFTNNASFIHDGIDTALKASAKQETEKVSLFTKIGKYDSATHTIYWEFTLNESGGQLLNTRLEDVLPQYLTYIDQSATYEVDGVVKDIDNNNEHSVSINKSTEDNKQKLTIKLGTLDKPAKLTFKTAISDDFYKQKLSDTNIENQAFLYWDVNGDGVDDGNIYSTGVVPNIGVSPIKKNFKNYNQSTGHISWEVVANPNNIPLTDIKINDVIEDGHTLIPSTVTLSVYNKTTGVTTSYGSLFDEKGQAISPFPIANGEITYYPATNNSKAYWEYKESNQSSKVVTNNKYIFNFDTAIDSTEVYQNNDENTVFKNEAFMYEKIADAYKLISQSPANYTPKSNVVTKTNVDYNYITNEFTWKVEINRNNNHLKNVEFTDPITGGMEYVKGSFTVDGNSISDDTAVKSTTVYDESSKKLSYYYETLNNQSIITFKTKLPKSYIDEHFVENKQYTFSNTAYLKHDGIANPATSTASKSVNNVLVGKSGDYKKTNDFVNWEVHINSNHVDYASFINTDGKTVIRDVLPSNLKLDVDSVKLYYESLKANGEYDRTGALIPDVYGTENINYNTVTNTFEFVLPTKLLNSSPDGSFSGYRLEFTTYITAGGTIENQVSFSGSSLSHNNTAKEISINWATIDGSLTTSRGTIVVEKVDARDANIKLAGAEFVLFNSNGIEIDRVVTDSKGKAEFKNLRFATPYTIQEVKAPEGYLLNSEAAARNGSTVDVSLDYSPTLTIPSTGTKSLTYTATNEIKRGSITFTKYGYDNVLLPGAEFTLYDTKNNSVATAVSNENGIVTFSDVAKGSYTIKETKAPEGYRLSANVLTANVIDEKATVNPISGATVANEIKRGKVTLTKIDNENNKLLAGATFGIYKEADTAFMTPLDKATTSSDGKLVFAEIPYGSYTIKEISPPEGYLANQTVYNVAITDDGQNVPITVANQVIKGSIAFTKIGLNNTPLENAVFELYDVDNKVVSTATSDINGKVRFDHVRYGSYTIKEVKAPTGYFVSSTVLTATISVDGEIVLTTPDELVNEPFRSDVKLLKVNSSNLPLQGGVFEIYDAADTDMLIPVGTATSDSDGIVLFKDIPYGEYVVKEVQAPSGYLINRDLLSVSIVADNQTYGLGSFVNEPAPLVNLIGSVIVKKVDQNNLPLAGAVFGLYTPTNKLVATSTSNKSGVAQFEEVEFGNYILKELSAPMGYMLSSKTYDVDVFIVDKPVNIEVVNEQITGNIEVNKVDSQDVPLSGALIGLYDEQGNEMARVSSNGEGKAIFTDIPYGNYYIQELQAPVGYELDTESKPISILINGLVSTIKFVNYELKLLDDQDIKQDSSEPVGKVETDNNNTHLMNSQFSKQDGSKVTSVTETANKQHVDVNNGNSRNTLPKTGDSITTKVIIFAIGVISIISIVVFGRRRKQQSA